MTNWTKIQKTLASDTIRTVFITGRPGIGKTYYAYHKGLRPDEMVYALTLTEDTPTAELRGHYIPSETGGLKWKDGPVISAMRNGDRLVLNEISHASEEALSFLHPILEDISTARITLPTGETVQAKEGFNVIATDNLPLDTLPSAIQDRFQASFTINSYHPEALDGLSPVIAQVARNTENVESEERTVSLRGWYAFQGLLNEGWSVEDSASVVFGNKSNSIVEAVNFQKAVIAEKDQSQ